MKNKLVFLVSLSVFFEMLASGVNCQTINQPIDQTVAEAYGKPFLKVDSQQTIDLKQAKNTFKSAWKELDSDSSLTLNLKIEKRLAVINTLADALIAGRSEEFQKTISKYKKKENDAINFRLKYCFTTFAESRINSFALDVVIDVDEVLGNR